MRNNLKRERRFQKRLCLHSAFSIDFKAYFDTLAGKAIHWVNLKKTLCSLLGHRLGDYQEVSHE